MRNIPGEGGMVSKEVGERRENRRELNWIYLLLFVYLPCLFFHKLDQREKKHDNPYTFLLTYIFHAFFLAYA